ncbi:hypothetical protein NQ314_003897 [Rhamnusium bicolor]|uniref:Beta-galactosidase n=1 Tax=Rhamnusium bicolor TaxID=1586634 RepID=A0AAV8ZN24_9CUCU|nr:hypothetical protein NQ314_003897 [Rhamnusium bicolor]
MTWLDKSLPTSYEYYTNGGITEGLSDNQDYFMLNGKNITIYSGSFHYFRVPRAYWRDRLRKMRAAGLNTVETYIPWNLHEPQPGLYDFGTGETDMQDFLHLEEFLKTAQEEDLFALVRPGPYICAEWEFGGLPSWILRKTTKGLCQGFYRLLTLTQTQKLQLDRIKKLQPQKPIMVMEYWSGDYTEKWDIVRELIAKHSKIQTKTPDPPAVKNRISYTPIKVEKQLLLSEVIDGFQNKITSNYIISMEKLSINGNSGQSYGYIVYRKTNLDIPANATLIIEDYIRDVVLVLLNGVLLNKPLKTSDDLNGFGYWRLKNSAIILSDTEVKNVTLDLVVENMGRVNLGDLSQFYQWKGLRNQVYLNYEPLTNWEIVPLEFKTAWNKALIGWHDIKNKISTPALYKVSFVITSTPQDTYINMKHWSQGIVIVNGFVLGRHILLGPQLSLYIPGSLLVKGNNDIIIFEHFNAADMVEFSSEPMWKNQLIQTSQGCNIKFNSIIGGIILCLIMCKIY